MGNIESWKNSEFINVQIKKVCIIFYFIYIYVIIFLIIFNNFRLLRSKFMDNLNIIPSECKKLINELLNFFKNFQNNNRIIKIPDGWIKTKIDNRYIIENEMQRRKEIVEGRSARRNFYRNDVINKVRRDCISFSSKHERNGGKSVIYRGRFSQVFLTAVRSAC